jgi:hypothetical protein
MGSTEKMTNNAGDDDSTLLAPKDKNQWKEVHYTTICSL